MLVRVLDHHDRRVDHRADGNRYATERHDVRVHALVVHDDERHQHAQGQRNDGDKCRAQMKQEGEAHQCHDDEPLDKLLLQIVDRALDEARPVVGRNDLDAGRQTRFERRELGLYRVDRLQRVLARAHDDDATGDLTLAVQLGNAAAHLRPHLDTGHVAQAHRHAGVGGHQGYLAEVVERLQIT